MKKNAVIFFCAVIVNLIAVFLFLATPPQAHAYAMSSAVGGNYNIGDSFQGLISPFSGFIDNLKWNNNTTINVGGTSSTWPTVKMTPVLQSGVQNILGQWFGDFDNWFYGLTGVQLSGISLVVLNALLWTLALAQTAVSWFVGLFH